MKSVNLVIQDLSGSKKSLVVDKSGVNESEECETFFAVPILEDYHICQAHFYRQNKKIFMVLNSYLLYKFLWEIENSSLYRSAWIFNVHQILQNSNFILIVEVLPEKPYIDHAWGWRLEKLAFERLELENTMSWLSTLGGAFSALGEEMARCALIAGRISVAQFRLATRLGDPDTQSRCRLYLALSLMQQGRLSEAKHIIRREHALAKSAPEETRDQRLVKMCLGMWAKLKYTYSLRREQRLCAG